MSPGDILEPAQQAAFGARAGAGRSSSVHASVHPGAHAGVHSPAPDYATETSTPRAATYAPTIDDAPAAPGFDPGRTRSARRDWRIAPTAAVSFVIHPRRVLKYFAIGMMLFCFLGFLQACLIGLAGDTAAWSIGRLFSLNYNGNLLSWLTGMGLFTCALLLALLAALARSSSDPLFKDWRLLTVAAAFLSMDEVASVHRLVLEPLRKLSGLTGIFQYGWLALSLLIAVVLWTRLHPFLKCCPPTIRAQFIVAFAIYFVGVLGMGLLGAVYAEMAASSGTLALVTLVNQFFEMFGILLFLRALLQYLADFAPRFHIQLEQS